MEKTQEEIVKEMQQVAEQMVLDDLEENPEMANEYFDCDCCGKEKSLAGSMVSLHARNFSIYSLRL